MRSSARDLPPLLRLLAAVVTVQRRLGLTRTAHDVVAGPPSRRTGRLVPSWTARPGPTDVTVSLVAVPARNGGVVHVRCYRAHATAGAAPVVVYAHGGGWVMGGLDTLDHVCRRMARDADAVVVSVDYRLAPEHQHPAALEDLADVLAWTRGGSSGLDVDPARVAVGGDSAGGNLAAAVALLDRDVAASPPLAAQLLIYPLLDATMSDEWARGYAGPGLSLTDCHELVRLYAAAGADLEGPLVSPLAAASLEGLPRALVVTAGVDVLRDQGRRYAERLLSDGVASRLWDFPRAPHGFYGIDRICRDGAVAQREVNAALRELLHARAAAPDEAPL